MTMKMRSPVLAAFGALVVVAVVAGSAAYTAAQDGAPAPVTVTLDVYGREMRVLGTPYQAWVFDRAGDDVPIGTVPGPIIRIPQGTELTIVLRNGHTEAHSFHTHIQNYPISSDGSSQTLPLPVVPHQNDNAAAVVHSGLEGPPVGTNPIGSGIGARTDHDVAGPGETYTYSFTAAEVGTFVYHCHVFPVAEHIERGLYGLIIVYPPGWSWNELPGDPNFGNTDAWVTDAQGRTSYEDVVILSEIDLTSATSKASVPTTGATGKVMTVNMKSWNDPYYLGRVTDGTPMRVIVANMGHEVHSWHIHGHNFDVLDKFDPGKRVLYRTDTLDVVPGQSYETTLVARFPGFWFVHDHMNQNAYGGMIAWLQITE